MAKFRWAHYSNICKTCNGHSYLYSSAKNAMVQCESCEGTGYGPKEPPENKNIPGSGNYVVTKK